MTITFQREPYPECIGEIQPVLATHYLELAVDQDDVPLDPDFDKYLDLHNKGILHMFTARADGELIGYIVGLIVPHIHYKSTVHYQNDIYYLRGEYRNSGVGYRFFASHEKDLKSLGVQRVIMATKCHQSHEQLFSALGFNKQDVVVSKII